MYLEKIIEVPIQHFSVRPDNTDISAIIIHDTGAKTAKSTLNWFLNPASKVSSHYLIDRDGTIYRCVDDESEAWHAGISNLHGKEQVNEFSVGIELVDADEKDKYPDEQLEALLEVCVELCEEHHIPLNRIVGHCHVAPGRKVD